MFQNLRANNQLFILHKDENPLVDIGSVVSVSAAKPKYPMPTPIGQIPQMEMVLFIDTLILDGRKNAIAAGSDYNYRNTVLTSIAFLEAIKKELIGV